MYLVQSNGGRSMPLNDKSGTELVSEVFEKLIDSQIANTQALTSLKETTEEVADRLKGIEGFFVNGFRGDLKQLLTELDSLKKKVNKTSETLEHMEDTYDQRFRERQSQYQEMTDKIESYKKIGFWFKVVAGFIGAIAVISTSVVLIMKYLG